MKTFDFKSHYTKLAHTNSEIEKILLETELFKFYENLSKEEQEKFKSAERNWRNKEFLRIKEEFISLGL